MTSCVWTTADYERMSWHDCHVHALRVIEGPYGAGELELDLDYIAEWRRREGRITFVLVPSHLRFHEVTDLSVTLDWATPTAGLAPFSLAGITREAALWRLDVNWPSGQIAFRAAGFTQSAWGREVEAEQQVLAVSERACR